MKQVAKVAAWLLVLWFIYHHAYAQGFKTGARMVADLIVQLHDADEVVKPSNGDDI